MAKYNIIFAPEAEYDLEEILNWYSTINHNLSELSSYVL